MLKPPIHHSSVEIQRVLPPTARRCCRSCSPFFFVVLMRQGLSHYVALAGLALTVQTTLALNSEMGLPLSLDYCDYKCALPHLAVMHYLTC